MATGTSTNTPKISMFGARNTAPMPPMPNRRWTALMGALRTPMRSLNGRATQEIGPEARSAVSAAVLVIDAPFASAYRLFTAPHRGEVEGRGARGSYREASATFWRTSSSMRA
jgi:hypothetical protein